MKQHSMSCMSVHQLTLSNIWIVECPSYKACHAKALNPHSISSCTLENSYYKLHTKLLIRQIEKTDSDEVETMSTDRESSFRSHLRPIALMISVNL